MGGSRAVEQQGGEPCAKGVSQLHRKIVHCRSRHIRIFLPLRHPRILPRPRIPQSHRPPLLLPCPPPPPPPPPPLRPRPHPQSPTRPRQRRPPRLSSPQTRPHSARLPR